ncbi:MAG: Vms1/Ankzf1 family peptidyl-tRNA hydrolase [Chloroflexota bacterium]|nr:Vms1/Ankzf1 family peptidyl-tRNA hydrolase [Chloroflexota bacterium]
MADDRILDTLVNFDGAGKVLSVYLDTELGGKSKEAVKLRFRDSVGALEESAAPEIEAVQDYLDFEFDWQTKGLGLWASGDALWEVVTFPTTVDNKAVYTKAPYIRILVDVLDRFAPYGVALVDKEKVRLFSVAWGRIQAESEAFGEEVKRHKQGGWAAARYQRHEDHLALRNLKNAVEIMEGFCQAWEYRRFVLGGTSEVLAQVKELLPQHLREWVVGDFVIDIQASPEEILERSFEVVQQADLEEEKRLVSGAFTAASKGGPGVTGLPDTVYALHQGGVLVLLVDEDYTPSGYVCEQCGYVSQDAQPACPLCGRDGMLEAPDVVDLAIHKAIKTGARVNIVRDNEQLREAGGIAALLRY